MKKAKLDFARYTNIAGPYGRLTPREANKFNTKSRELPLHRLESLIKPHDTPSGDFLIHWFRSDLRVNDNTALYHMCKDAKKSGAKLMGLYVISTKFWRWHNEGAYKIDFILRSLKALRAQLKQLGIPLSVVYLDDLKEEVEFGKWFNELMKRLKGTDLYFNILYEYDELNRDIQVLETEIKVHAFHDQCIVKPGELTTGKGTQYSKFTPWYKKWDAYLSDHPIQLLEIKGKDKFEYWEADSDEYTLDAEFMLDSLGEYGVERFHAQPAGSYEAMKQLDAWMESIKRYEHDKDFPIRETTSRLSAHVTVGTISTRQIVSKVQELNKGKRVGGDPGCATYIKEVAWRDFYRNIVASWPFVMLYTPFNFSALDISWDPDISRFEKWCLGRTGFPLIDAAMRELLYTGFMNNRLRMVTACFLSKDLLQDWRMGEKWFHHHLTDADLASNNGGWGWCSSTGVDAQPWFRIFNVYTQSAKFDPEGEYIKRWCPELKNLSAKEIHQPPAVDGYPEPIVDRKEARELALQAYRDALT